MPSFKISNEEMWNLIVKKIFPHTAEPSEKWLDETAKELKRHQPELRVIIKMAIKKWEECRRSKDGI